MMVSKVKKFDKDPSTTAEVHSNTLLGMFKKFT
jgi:hypothetical protein